MLLARLRSGSLRDAVVALLVALSLLAGVMQMRAASEAGAQSGFAHALTLCLQSGGPASPDAPPDHACDPCRMPTHPVVLALPLAAPERLLRSPEPAHVRRPTRPHDAILIFRPGSRGPPVAV